MATQYRVNPRIRAYGKARIDVTRRARDEREWQALWHEPRFPFPFTWGDSLKQCMQYTVEDFAAEIGFFIDILGFPVSAFSTNYAQFTSPDQAFFFAVREGGEITPPDSLSIQFMLKDLAGTIQQLEGRGVVFEHKPEAGNASPAIAVLRSPHGVRIELWETPPLQPVVQPEAVQSDELADFWSDEGADDEFDLESEANDEKSPAQMQFEDIEESSQSEELAPRDLPEEPVYVDDEEPSAEDPPAEPPPASKEVPPHPRPSFPTAVIRRTEDLYKKGSLRIPNARPR
jgi:catechol 2,3-dioxygenase-like lactoylglutathione lyase family enzyme